MMTWKKYIAISISLLLIFSGARRMNGCGGWEEPDYTANFLLWDGIIDAQEYKPFFFTPSSQFLYTENLPSYSEEVVQDWQNYFRGELEEKHIGELIDGLSERQLLICQSSKTESTLVKNGISKKIAQYVLQPQSKELIEYLLFARKCEHASSHLDPWQGCGDNIPMKKYIDNPDSVYNKYSSPFIKQRVGFLLTRLATYGNQSDRAISFYDKYVDKEDFKEMNIRYWAMCHKAASLLKKEQMGEAAYLYSCAFAKCPSRREGIYLSMRFRESYKEALEFCKTSQEKINVNFVAGLEYLNTERTDNIKNIYDIDPNAKELELLAYKQIKIWDVGLVSDYSPYNAPSSYYDEEAPSEQVSANASDEQKRFETYLNKLSSNAKVKNKGYWSYLTYYWYFSRGNFQMAETFKNKLYSLPQDQNARYKIALEMMDCYQQIQRMEKIDTDFEEALGKKFATLDSLKTQCNYEYNPSIFLIQALASRYITQGDELKSILCTRTFQPSRWAPEDVLESSYINDLLAFIQKKNKNSFETFLAKSYKEQQLYLSLGTAYLREAKFQEAINAFTKGKESRQVFGDPYDESKLVCIYCSSEEQYKDKYTQKYLAKELADYLEKAKQTKDKNKAANYYYKIGLALYNTTYFGSAWSTTASFRSGSTWGVYETQSDSGSQETTYKTKVGNGEEDKQSEKLIGFVPYDIDYTYGPRPHLNCSYALSYFNKALSLTKDKEMAAKICFFAAKCEAVSDKASKEYFSVLKKNYTQTKYYHEIISECSWFREYLKKKKI